MNLLSQLKPFKGSSKNRKRLGRGHSTGQGGTAGKGHKGQKARAGGRVRRGFEGGQSPLARRLPKFGFRNPFSVRYQIVNISELNSYSGSVGPEELLKYKSVGAEAGPRLKRTGAKSEQGLKILARGKLEKALKVRAHCFSKAAIQAIEAAGGQVEVIK